MAIALSAAERAHWNIYGELPPKPETPPNFMRRVVLWLKSHETPLVQKIAAYAAAFLASLAIGILSGHSYFVTAVVYAGISGWVEKEKHTLKKEELQKRENAGLALLGAAHAFNRFTDVKGIFGGEQRWDQLPVLDLGDRVGKRGLLGTHLRMQNLPHPIMKGTDIHGRPFVSLKLVPRYPALINDHPPEVLTFFQRYVGKPEWAFTFSKPFDRDDLQLVLENNHVDYVLAD